MIYAVKNENESNEKMLLRYKKLFFQSRISSKLKAERYSKRDPKKRKIREKAIIRTHYRDLAQKVYF
jgi:ribosomal protein S21